VKDLIYQLVCLTRHNHDGSFATQSNRKHILTMCGGQLLEHKPYRRLRVTTLDPDEHPAYLVTRWKAEGLSHATIKNRLCALRWWAEKIGKAGQMPSNADFGLEPRRQVATVSKAQDLPPETLARIPDVYVRMSLELQRAFGLRREEAMKLRPHQADHGGLLALQGSWCKNGRPRTVPIRTAAQREVLERAKALVGGKDASLIPPHLKYVEQLHRYEYWTARVGLHRMHGLRHAYSVERYQELAGFPCPIEGGPTHKELTPSQRMIDTDTRLRISHELGHGRKHICSTYIGS
jgi:site-specific recombinase XerC